MDRGVMRLSTTLDCWKNNCHGATVVPTMAMINSTASEVTPPLTPGTKKDFAACSQCGCDINSIGLCSSVIAMKTNNARSHRRKLPVDMMASSAISANGTTTYLGMPM